MGTLIVQISNVPIRLNECQYHEHGFVHDIMKAE